MRQLKPQALTRDVFAPFGEVIEMQGHPSIAINQGFAQRFNDLGHVDVMAEGGAVNISIVAAAPRPMPIAIKLMERHPLGSQIFYPLQDRDWLVLVAGDLDDAASFRAFTASGRQGVNYVRNIWHHPLLVFEEGHRFLMVDRKGPGNNLEEVWFPENRNIVLTP